MKPGSVFSIFNVCFNQMDVQSHIKEAVAETMSREGSQSGAGEINEEELLRVLRDKGQCVYIFRPVWCVHLN